MFTEPKQPGDAIETKRHSFFDLRNLGSEPAFNSNQ